MKTSRFRYSYRVSASKLHKKVGEILRNSSVLKGFSIYQEYPVSKINPGAGNRFRFDWIILELKVVIECMGCQHYTPTTFGGDGEDSIDKFRVQKGRDIAKREAALSAGWKYIEIPYTLEKSITEAQLLEMISQTPIREVDLPEKEVDTWHQERLKKAREYNKLKYQKLKKLLQSQEDNSNAKTD